MSRFIGVEDVIANALIELMSRGKRNVSLEMLMEYGTVVIKVLHEKNQEAVLLVSSEYTDAAIRNYSEYFDLTTIEDKEYIQLKEGITTEMLLDRFRSYLALDVILAFIDKKSLEALGVK